MTERHPIDELKALAHPLRYAIITTLGKGEMNVGEIEEASEIGQPTLSQQLAVLRKAGLVETRRDAKLVFYSLAKDRLVYVASALAAMASIEAGTSTTTPKTTSKSPPTSAANFARMLE